jgi:hypothetical protein
MKVLSLQRLPPIIQCLRVSQSQTESSQVVLATLVLWIVILLVVRYLTISMHLLKT